MSTTINEFLKKYNQDYPNISSYGNDMLQTITKVLNGEINNHTDPKNDPLALYNLGQLYKNQRKLDLAEKYFLMAAGKNDPSSMYSLGLLYKNQRKFDLAEKYYIMAIQYNHSGALNNLGLLYKKQNKLNLAEEYYLMA